ncbi:hypothetical protein ABVT39_018103 [Epinephelus coioides]
MPSMPHDPVTSAASSADDSPAKEDQTILTSDCAPTAAVCGVVALVVCSLIAAVVRYKCRWAKADFQGKITYLQNELQKRDREEQKNIAQVMSSLQGLIRDLEAQRDQVKGELKRVEAEREENKRQLWLVEAEITEREKLFDKPEGLLRDKEKLLQAQWKLDETKRNTERQILNIEKVLEPVEIQLILEEINKRLDCVIRDVEEVKTSLEFTQDKLEDMRMGHKQMERKIKSFENNAMSCKLGVYKRFAKLDYSENQYRRINILIDGIPDEKRETWSDSEKKVQQMLSSNLGQDGTNIDIERTRRIGLDTPRKTVVQLLKTDSNITHNSSMPSMKHDPVTSAAYLAHDIPAKLVQTILTSDCASMAAVRRVVGLGIGGLIIIVVWYKWRRAKADLQRKITSLQNELRIKTEEQENIAQNSGMPSMKHDPVTSAAYLADDIPAKMGQSISTSDCALTAAICGVVGRGFDVIAAVVWYKCRRAATSADDIPAKMGQNIFTSDCVPMAVVCGVTGLGVGGLIAAVVWYKCRRAKPDSRRKTSHESETQRMKIEGQENIAQVVSSLQEQIRDLEAQRDQVKEELQRVEAEREENKRQLQSVEAEITEREKLFDKPEGLLGEKEKLLQAQWKLDETKRNLERQILNIEKELEPVEIQSTSVNGRIILFEDFVPEDLCRLRGADSFRHTTVFTAGLQNIILRSPVCLQCHVIL